MVCQYGKCRKPIHHIKASYDGVDLGRRLLSLRRLFLVVVVVLRDQRNCVKETELETPLKVITSKRITQIVVANFVKSTKQNQTNRCKTRSEEKQSHRSGEKKTTTTEIVFNQRRNKPELTKNNQPRHNTQMQNKTKHIEWRKNTIWD